MQFTLLRKKPLFILLAVLLITMAGLWLFSKLNSDDGIISGTAYLKEASFSSGDLYKLRGRWEIYPDRFLETGAIEFLNHDKTYQPVPGNWNDFMEPRGFATYRLLVKVPPEKQDLMILMPNVSTSYTFYINGEKRSSNGKIGEKPSEAKPEYTYNLVEVGRHQGELELIIQISNFDYNKGGLWIPPSIGTIQTVERHFRLGIFTKTIIAGGVFLVGIILITLFAVRREYKAYANIGLFCLIMALRTLIVGEVAITYFFPGFNWYLLVRLEYLTMTTGALFLNSYFYCIYKTYYGKRIFIIFNSAALLFSIIIIASPVYAFTSLLIGIQIILMIGILNFAYLFIKSGEKMKEENLILLTGITVMLALVFLDILIANNLIIYVPVRINSSLGLLVLIFCNALLLIRQAARTSTRMLEMTNNLEGLVRQRTMELEEANRKLSEQAVTDVLTGVYNRHEFGNVMKNEDARYRRSGKNYAALYMDLDNFKYINDTFGHPAGDLILTNFAALLKQIVRDTDFLFRLGGDEFFILMTEIGSGKDAVKLADRILTQLNDCSTIIKDLERFLKKPVEIPSDKCFSLSIGISSTDIINSQSLHSLPSQADMALLEAKATGKNRYAIYSIDEHEN